VPGGVGVERFVRDAYEQILVEADQQGYTAAERRLLSDDTFYYGRVLRESTRAYALDSTVWNISRAVHYLGLAERGSAARVVDLGSGLGMQSILFAALGARVLAVDLSLAATELAAKRAAWFERLWGRRLQIEFLQGDFSTMDLQPHVGRHSAFFSMSAFSHIPPLRQTVERATTLLEGEGRAFIWDINPAWLHLRAFRPSQRHLPSPREVCNAFAESGYVVDFLGGGTALPSMAWRVPALRPLAALGNRAARNWTSLSINFVLGARQRA
jgi:2-polyprenyl-3-methyl-5-hydroxy-6-metoxy-1,4-benzoquinol methylase